MILFSGIKGVKSSCISIYRENSYCKIMVDEIPLSYKLLFFAKIKQDKSPLSNA
jgi:hypothetical protein